MAAENGHASVVPLLLADTRVEVNAINKVSSSHTPMVHILSYAPCDEGGLCFRARVAVPLDAYMVSIPSRMKASLTRR